MSYHNKAELKNLTCIYMHAGTHPSMKGQESDSNTTQKLLSGFINEMSKDGMLLPERSINLGSIVGQG